MTAQRTILRAGRPVTSGANRWRRLSPSLYPRHVNVGDSIRYSLDHWDNDEWEPAMLHACMAVDGTASKLYPDLGNRERFERMVRENIAVLTQWTAPGINLEKSLFPVRLKRGQPRQPMDTAAIL